MPFTAGSFKVETADGRNIRLLEAVTFYTHDLRKIVIPAGATSDGASVPQAVWNILPPFGDYWRAAVLHDWLYRNSDLPKAECDNVFREALTDLAIPYATRETLYQGVHLGGQAAFDAARKIR